MAKKNSIKLFGDKLVRSVWDEEKEEWYFSVVDVVGALTEQETARSASTYWAVLKKRLKEEGADELRDEQHAHEDEHAAVLEILAHFLDEDRVERFADVPER